MCNLITKQAQTANIGLSKSGVMVLYEFLNKIGDLYLFGLLRKEFPAFVKRLPVAASLTTCNTKHLFEKQTTEIEFPDNHSDRLYIKDNYQYKKNCNERTTTNRKFHFRILQCIPT